jgi:thiol-disulfide isomerase/thioredoxin
MAKALLVVGVLVGLTALAGEVELLFFWSATCPDCMEMKEFLAQLSQEVPELRVVPYEVTFEPDNWRLMVTLARVYGLTKETTPTVFVGELGVTGVGRAVELQIRQEVLRCREQGCASPLERLPEELAGVLSPLELGLLVLGVVAVVYLVYLWSAGP